MNGLITDFRIVHIANVIRWKTPGFRSEIWMDSGGFNEMSPKHLGSYAFFAIVMGGRTNWNR